MPVDRRGDSNLGHEHASVANEGAGGKSGDGQPDAGAASFLDFAPIVDLENVSHFVAENKRELCFIFEDAEKGAVNQDGAVRKRGSIDFGIFHDKETKFDGAASSFGAFRNERIAKM